MLDVKRAWCGDIHPGDRCHARVAADQGGVSSRVPQFLDRFITIFTVFGAGNLFIHSAYYQIHTLKIYWAGIINRLSKTVSHILEHFSEKIFIDSFKDLCVEIPCLIKRQAMIPEVQY